jgi:hypothetical protein
MTSPLSYKTTDSPRRRRSNGLYRCGIGSLALAVALVLSGSSSAVSRPGADNSSITVDLTAATTLDRGTSVTAAKLIQPPGPISAHPSLLDEANAACQNARVDDTALCAGTVDAEIWGLPLVVMSHTRDLLACRIGVNHLYNSSSLAGPSSTSVVAPNDDTLYSTAFLDLRAGPLLLTVPPIRDRYLDFQLMDMYTNTIADIGVLTNGGHAGTYAFVGPGWHGTIPNGTYRIDVPTPDAWLLGRTQVKGPGDLATTVALQKNYALRALAGHGSGTAGGPSTLACPAQALPKQTTLAFLDALGDDMAADPPVAADTPVVRAMGLAGIGSGRMPGSGGSTSAAEYLQALQIGQALLASAVGHGSTSTATGWSRGAVVGSYGTDYMTRAIVAVGGLGAQVPTQAVYFHLSGIKSGVSSTPFVGTRSYEVRFAADDLPPHGPDGFWSITMYNSARFLVANPIDRYSIGDHTPDLVRSRDGSLTVVMSATRPSESGVNWLPAPAGSFSITLRVYDPTQRVLDGSWSPPSVRATA